MNLHQAQSEIAKDTHRFRVVRCGRRFGKTFLSVYEMLAKAVFTEEANIAYIAPTHDQARGIAWIALLKAARPSIISTNEQRLELVLRNHTGGESIIHLKGWESIESARGRKYDLLVLDEVASYRNFWIGWHEVLRATLVDNKGDALFIGTPKGFNHFYDLANIEKDDQDYKSFNFTSFDNPHMPKEEIEKARQEITEDRFAQEYMADFRKTEGLVYKEFDRAHHLFDDHNQPEYINRFVAVDWGYTNPSCILYIREDKDGGFWVVDEWYKTKQTTAQIVQIAQSYLPEEVYPDPAEPDRIEELRKAGLNVRDVSKDIPAGISRVRELFKQGRLHIHKKCVNLIFELETYRYPDRKPDQNENEKPIKENDHALDSLRYALYTKQPQQVHTEFEPLAITDW